MWVPHGHSLSPKYSQTPNSEGFLFLLPLRSLPFSWLGCDVRWLALVPDPVHPVQGNPLPHNPRRALYVSWGLVHSGWNCASGCGSPCCGWDWCWRHSSSGTHRSAGSTLSEGLDLLEGLILPFCLTHRGQECSLCCLLCLHCCSSQGCWQCCCLSFADPAPPSPCPPWTGSLAPLSSSVSSWPLTSSSWSGRRRRWGRLRSWRQWRRPWWSVFGCRSVPLCCGWWWGFEGSPYSGGGSLQTGKHLRTGRCKTCSWKRKCVIKAGTFFGRKEMSSWWYDLIWSQRKTKKEK